MAINKIEIIKKGRKESFVALRVKACIPPHKKGTARSGALILNRRSSENNLTKKLQPNSTIAGKIYQNKTSGVKVPI